jgi:hypothetical protein
VPVLHWISHHRLWSLSGGLAVLVVLALGGLWFFVLRSAGTPIDLRQALLQYRQLQRTDPGLSTGLPRSGVYGYLTSGGEQLSVGGIARSFPPTSQMVVTDARCATVLWEPFEEHQEQMVLCPSPGSALTMTSALTREELAGLQTTDRIRCGTGAYVVPPPSTGPRWHATCHGSNQAIAFDGRLLGSGPMVIDGRHEEAIHTRVTLTFTGTQVGTNPTDYWISVDDGLILREQETVDIAQQAGALGAVQFDEHMAISLLSTTANR